MQIELVTTATATQLQDIYFKLSVDQYRGSKAKYIALSIAIQKGKWVYKLLCETMAAAGQDTRT